MILKKIVELFSPIISFLLAYSLNNLLNIARMISFIPKERQEQFNISLYLVLLKSICILCSAAIEKIRNKYGVSLTIVAASKNATQDLNVNPEIILNKNSMGEILIHFQIQCLSDKLKDVKIMLDFPKWIQPQCKELKEVNGRYEFNMEEITGYDTNGIFVKTEVTKDISFIQQQKETGKKAAIKLNVEASFLTRIISSIHCNSFMIKIPKK